MPIFIVTVLLAHVLHAPVSARITFFVAGSTLTTVQSPPSAMR